jgi:hypothetical protein
MSAKTNFQAEGWAQKQAEGPKARIGRVECWVFMSAKMTFGQCQKVGVWCKMKGIPLIIKCQ